MAGVRALRHGSPELALFWGLFRGCSGRVWGRSALAQQKPSFGLTF
jgi:hypothetical protein